MKMPNEAVIADCKARASATRGVGEVVILEVEEADFCGVFRSPTRLEWNPYLDGSAKNETIADARYNLLVRCMLWPSVAELSSARRDCPGAMQALSDGVEEIAGGKGDGGLRMIPLSVDTSAEDLEAAGLARDAVTALLAKYPSKGQLKIAIHPAAGAMVVKRPSAGEYNQCAREMRTSLASSAYDLAMSCVVHPEKDEAKRELFDRWPGVPHVLSNPLLEHAGALAKARRKKA